MKGSLLFVLIVMLIAPSAEAQLVLSTQFINPCGGDEHNEYIMARSAIADVGISSIFFGSYNPSSNLSGVGGTQVVDYDYWWAGQQDGTGQLLSPYPTFSNFPGESCGNGVNCYGFLHPSIPSDSADIDYLITQLNTAAGCNVFLPVPSATERIPANNNIIIFLGAGFRSASGLCGFDYVTANLNFSNHCNGTTPLTTFYAVFGKGDKSGPNCNNTDSGYLPNDKRRVTALYHFYGGRLTNLANYTSSFQDYTPGDAPAPGNAGIIVSNNSGGTYWINNLGCVPAPMTIVPITLEYFTAIIKDKNGLIKWKSNGEEGIDVFTVEKSVNGRDFYPLKSLAPQNRPGAEYTITDNELATGNNFYRLKTISLNGKVDYSSTARINCSKGNSNNWFVYPNPATSGTSLFYPSIASKNIMVSIIDVAGKIILMSKEKILPGNNTIDLGIQRLTSGMYFVKVSDEGRESLIPIIKK